MHALALYALLATAAVGVRLPQAKNASVNASIVKSNVSVAKPASPPAANRTEAERAYDIAKLQRIEKGLEKITAMEGAKAVVEHVHRAETEVLAAKTSSEMTGIMKNVSSDIETFKKKLILRKKALEASQSTDAAASDAFATNITVPKLPSHQESEEVIVKNILKHTNLTKAKAQSLSPIVRQLQARLDHLDYQQKKAELQEKELEKRTQKVASNPLHGTDDKEAKKAQKLMKYLKKKTQRAFKKKEAEWKNEEKAVNSAISAIMEGNAEKVQKAMDRLNAIHNPTQEFLH